MPLSPNLRGATFMAISMAGFAINDALVKFASAQVNMGQIMFVRGMFATVLIGIVAWRHGALTNLRQALHPMIWLRAIGELGGTVFFLVALAHLPIANVSAVLQALPLGVTMGAALVLGEQVGWRRWIAIAVGFSGVMVIVRPGFDGFSIYAISALICVAFCVVRDLATRRIDNSVPTLLISFVTAAFIAGFGAAAIPPLGGWTPLGWQLLWVLGAAGSLLVVGYHFIIEAMRTGDISFIAPFRYTALLWSILLGFLVFNDVPDLPMIVGAAIIVGSGLYTLYRERIVGGPRPAALSTSPAMPPDGL